jgi:hypothetical protein
MVGAVPPEVDVILPCLNEAQALGWVLGRIPAGIRPIVVDNGSTDGSADIARGHGAQVVCAPQPGYGAACHAGVLAAMASVVAVMDADASLNPQQLDRVVAPIIDGTADLVIGSRRPVSAAAFPWPLRLANRELARRVHRRTGLMIADLGPMRAARCESLLALQVRDRRSGYPVETLVAPPMRLRTAHTWTPSRRYACSDSVGPPCAGGIGWPDSSSAWRGIKLVPLLLVPTFLRRGRWRTTLTGVRLVTASFLPHLVGRNAGNYTPAGTAPGSSGVGREQQARLE